MYLADPVGDQRWQANWVPVEERVWGVDRRTLLPAGLVVLLFVLTAWALPAIDDGVVVDDPVGAGDIVQVGTAVQFTPAVGANLLAGLRQGQAGTVQYPSEAAVSVGDAVFTVTVDGYRGTATSLLKQLDKTSDRLRVTTEPVTVTTASGLRGVSARFEGASSTGVIAAFVFEGTGVAVTAAAPFPATAVPTEVNAMIQSIRRTS